MKATLNAAHYPHYKFLEALRQSGETNMCGAYNLGLKNRCKFV